MLKRIDENGFDRMFSIMESSFPRDEYRTYEGQKALLGKSEYNLLGLFDGETLKGFIAVWKFDYVTFIEHFAVSEKYRNEGLGSKILGEIAENSDKIICLEVEPPKDEMSIRRIEFYKRNGFYFNDYPYVQPAMAKGKKEIPLFIMTANRGVTEGEFEKIKDELYRRVYHVR